VENKMNLIEKEMRLLCGIVLDAADVARNSEIDMDTKCEITQLASKIVKIVNEMYPVADDDEESIFGTK
jgi:hypothetical protein